jgi:hypothetical protein
MIQRYDLEIGSAKRVNRMSDEELTPGALPLRSTDRFPMIRVRSGSRELFETPRGYELTAALEALYFAFRNAKLDSEFACCPHCFTPSDVRFLRDTQSRKLSLEEIGLVFGNAISTLGTAADFNHFLPRVLEAWALRALDSPEGLPSRLVAARAAGWSPEQLTAIVQFVRAMFSCINALDADTSWYYELTLELEPLKESLPEAADAIRILRSDLRGT